nr:hypothetical protein [Gammaproteobacteria bacterium]
MAQPGCSSAAMVSLSNCLPQSPGSVASAQVTFAPEQSGCKVGVQPYMIQLDMLVSCPKTIDAFHLTMLDASGKTSMTGPSFTPSGGNVGWLNLPNGFYGNNGVKMLPVSKAVGTFHLVLQLWLSRYGNNPGQILQVQGESQGTTVLCSQVHMCAGSANCLYPLTCGPSGHCSSSAVSLMPHDGVCCCPPADQQLADQVGTWMVDQVSHFVPQLHHLLTSMLTHYSKLSGSVSSVPGLSYQAVMSQDLGTGVSVMDYDSNLKSSCNCSSGSSCPPSSGPPHRCLNNVWDNPGNLGGGEGTLSLCHSPLGFCSCDCIRTPVAANPLSIAFKSIYFLPVSQTTYGLTDARWRVGLDLEVKNLGLWGIVSAFLDNGVKQGNIYGVAKIEFQLEEINPDGTTVTMLIDIPGNFQVTELEARTLQLQYFTASFDNLYLTKLISVASVFVSSLTSFIQDQVVGVIASQVKPLLEHLGKQYVPVDFGSAMQSFVSYVNDNPAAQNEWLTGLFPSAGVPVSLMGQELIVSLASGQQLGINITSAVATDATTFSIQGHLVSDVLIEVKVKSSGAVLSCDTLKMLDPNRSTDFPSGSVCGLPVGTSVGLAVS